MTLDGKQRELIELTSRFCDGGLERVEFERLETMLRADATSRRLYRAFTELHGELSWNVGRLKPRIAQDASDLLQDIAAISEPDYLPGVLSPMGTDLPVS